MRWSNAKKDMDGKDWIEKIVSRSRPMVPTKLY